MAFDISMIKAVYNRYPEAVKKARATLNRPLTLTEKILYSHLHHTAEAQEDNEVRTTLTLHQTAWPCRMLLLRWPTAVYASR